MGKDNTAIEGQMYVGLVAAAAHALPMPWTVKRPEMLTATQAVAEMVLLVMGERDFEAAQVASVATDIMDHLIEDFKTEAITNGLPEALVASVVEAVMSGQREGVLFIRDGQPVADPTDEDVAAIFKIMDDEQ